MISIGITIFYKCNKVSVVTRLRKSCLQKYKRNYFLIRYIRCEISLHKYCTLLSLFILTREIYNIGVVNNSITEGEGIMKEPIMNFGKWTIDTLIGSWDSSVEILLIVMALDYLTGVAGAFKTKTLSSSAGYKGLVKKATIFIIVILAAQIDKMLNVNNDLFRNCTAIFFIVNDSLSILENAGKMGMKLPSFLKTALIKLQNQTEVLGDEEALKIKKAENDEAEKQTKENDQDTHEF